MPAANFKSLDLQMNSCYSPQRLGKDQVRRLSTEDKNMSYSRLVKRIIQVKNTSPSNCEIGAEKNNTGKQSHSRNRKFVLKLSDVSLGRPGPEIQLK